MKDKENAKDRIALYESCISILDAEMRQNDRTIIVGDWNADPYRNSIKKVDKIFVDFLSRNGLIKSRRGSYNTFSYCKGEYGANLDHIVLSRGMERNIIDCKLIVDNLDVSDHKPIKLELKWHENATICVEKKKTHKFQWKNALFKSKFAECTKKKRML